MQLHSVKEWKCQVCGHYNNRDNRCAECGTLCFKAHSRVKYGILGDYLPALSKIVGKSGWPHIFIDACAGSGKVQIGNELIDGSPLIMAKVREEAQRPSLRCTFIESHGETYDRLVEAIQPYSEFTECIHGDCNEKLFEKLDAIPDQHFAFVFLDPFGLGKPTIRRETVVKLMERPNTEILINLSWLGISRAASDAFKRYNDDEQARSTAKTLDLYFGGREGWWDIEKNCADPHQRRQAYLELYEKGWQRYYSHIEHLEIPPGHPNPIYYLIFTTRHDLGRKIMKDILPKWRKWRAPGVYQLSFTRMGV